MNAQLVGFTSGDAPYLSEESYGYDSYGWQEVLDRFYRPLPMLKHYEKLGISLMNLEVIERKVVAFAVQYGTTNENTVKMVLNYLENVRDVAFEKFSRNQLQLSLCLLSKCMAFVTPCESSYCYKFLSIKIDVVNKLMYVLGRYRKRYDRKGHRQQLETGLAFISSFLEELEKQSDFNRLVAEPSNFMETNYMFAGKFYRKCGQTANAIRMYERALDIVTTKLLYLDLRKDNPDLETATRLTVLRINCLYKLSKCHRGDSSELQRNLEQQATSYARQHNNELFLHISRKVREFHEKQNFKNVLERLDCKRRIECEVMRLIEESKHSEASLYNYFDY